ncbi:hypothetical protein BC939DRAFT_328171 [Gamsiella multidivaricata]|uniref:uncharacterized protein n=1 Tax=Gamsiella multidivaricata TaxID=101098 RepID=UPI00221F1B4A|nr:uncharacterized protein BC939DRAFT_328171 [Gamsiella multidivaricata]KAG0370353.1 hypothetical protein BGZ54_006710 [Gamsiella multidivaricata]KAI7817550.1 hypothetical protein BC939DRAFT_328171 [Gamsiella multidivaricata]
MSKSGAPSASASASVSSHDPHSLPPNVKGLIQRYLAVSLPTITLTPEVIDVLDRSEVLIPSRIQVTMRWWKEDTASSLSVYPKLNSPLPEAIERRQAMLQRRKDLEKQQQHQKLLQQQRERQQQHLAPGTLHHHRSHDLLHAQPSTSSAHLSQAQVPTQNLTQTQAHSPTSPRASPFLKRPWAGARLLNVFRRSKSKSKEPSPAPGTSGADTRASEGLTPTPTPTPTPTHHDDLVSSSRVDLAVVDDSEAEAKPLPSLPDAAYPITVAYPVRCTLEQLRRYFVEMTSLTLEIHITPQLSVLATVSNLTDLFQNLNGTFSGVFPFSTVMQNDDPRLASEALFKKRVVLGMVVFQAWSQDTSEVNDSDEESDSISTNSMLQMLADNAPGGMPPHMHPSYHHRHLTHHLQPQNPQQRLVLRSEPQPQQHRSHHHPQQQQHPQRQQQQQQHRPHPQTQNSLMPLYPPPQQRIPPPVGPSQVPYPQHEYDSNPARFRQRPNPTQHPISPPHMHRQPLTAGTPSRTQYSHVERGHPAQGPPPPIQGRPADRDSFGHRISMRYDEDPLQAQGDQRRVLPRPHTSVAAGPPFPRGDYRTREDLYRPSRERLTHAGRYHDRQDSTIEEARAQDRRPNARIPVPGVGTSGGPFPQNYRHHHQQQQQQQHHHRHHHRQEVPPSSVDDDTNAYSQGGRSRPRAGATAAAIGRLDSVLARGQDLLHGMRTSLALDPEEVQNMSARNIRSSAMRDDLDDDRFIMPYHEVLPYWPAKSRFSLEMSIPTAYLTTRGLLKGSKQKKHSSMPLSGSSRDPTSSASDRRDRDRDRDRSETPRAFQPRQSRPPDAEYSMQQGQPGPSSQYPQERRGRSTRQQEYQQQPQHQRQPWADPTPVSASTMSTPRPLRRSARPIQFEKLSSRSDLARLRMVQEESMRPQYQSFEPDPSGADVGQSSGYARERFPLLDQHPSSQAQPSPYTSERQRQQQGSNWSQYHQNQSAGQQRSPRKSKSYPPPPPSSRGRGSRSSRRSRRRLSSNDRLQLRMNPKAGDMLNYIPDLFPNRSMSGLLVPEYISSSSGSSRISTGNSSSSGSTEEDEYGYGYGAGGGVDMSGRTSRLQKRPHRSYRHHREDQQQAKRHQSQRSQNQQSPHQQRAEKSRRRHARGSRVHPQHFNFKVDCQLQLTPEVMAACMVENISVEVWKLNSKRQTMIELGSAKLPLHKVLSRIMHKTAVMGPQAASAAASSALPMPGRHYPGGMSSAAGGAQRRGGYVGEGHSRAANVGYKEGWRLEPSVYDIRSRHGTVIGQLDAHVWIHPRSRSDSMVSAAA